MLLIRHGVYVMTVLNVVRYELMSALCKDKLSKIARKLGYKQENWYSQFKI